MLELLLDGQSTDSMYCLIGNLGWPQIMDFEECIYCDVHCIQLQCC
jgi:hypothetical protein